MEIRTAGKCATGAFPFLTYSAQSSGGFSTPHTLPGSSSANPSSQSFSYSPIEMQFTTRAVNIGSRGETSQPNPGSYLQRAMEPRRTSLRVDEDYHA